MIRQPMDREKRRLQQGYQSQVYQQMRRYFAPASIMPAPLSNPQETGGRNTVLTADNAANVQATDSATIQLVNGSLTWYYATKFKTPPNVTATPVGQPPSTGTTVHLKGPGSNVAVIVQSTDATDNRLVNLHAVAAP